MEETTMTAAAKTPGLAELQTAVDAASSAYGKAMRDYENGVISPAEFGQFKRRMKRAEKALQRFKSSEATEVKVTEPQLRALRKMVAENDGPFSAGNARVHQLSNRMVSSYRLAQSLVDRGLATRSFGDDFLYITEAGRAAVAKAEGRSDFPASEIRESQKTNTPA